MFDKEIREASRLAAYHREKEISARNRGHHVLAETHRKLAESNDAKRVRIQTEMAEATDRACWKDGIGN